MHGYDDDLFLWAQEQAALLRAGKLESIDKGNVAGELESVARELKHELGARFSRLQQSLFQWEHLDGARLTAWYITIHDERSAIPLRIENAPTLRIFLDEEYINAWSLARTHIIMCTGLNERLVPRNCPYSVEQALDWKFWPGPPEARALIKR
jgi:hypothetical protein